MRENRTSGSEGGGTERNSLPLFDPNFQPNNRKNGICTFLWRCHRLILFAPLVLGRSGPERKEQGRTRKLRRVRVNSSRSGALEFIPAIRDQR